MSGTKSSILILGAGVYQVPAIKKAKLLGYNAIVLSYNVHEYPGYSLADIAIEADTTDIDKVVSIAKEYKILGVFTTGTDVALPALGKVNDELGLTGPSFESCLLSTNKILMKEAFERNHVPASEFKIVYTLREAKKAAGLIGYPVMVKATRSSGSRGISKAESSHELNEAWNYAKQYSNEGDGILVEEFLQGTEFGAQAFIYDNEIKLVCPHNDTVTRPPYCTPIGHSYPFSSLNPDEIGQIKSVCKRGIQSLRMNNCAVNIDLIKSEEGIKVLEIGARMGATCCPELTEVYTGIDVTKECINMAMGHVPDFSVRGHQPVAALLLRSPQTGTLKKIYVPNDVTEDPDLINISFDVREGDHVNSFVIGPDRIGHIIVKGDSYHDAERKAEQLENKIKIEVKV